MSHHVSGDGLEAVLISVGRHLRRLAAGSVLLWHDGEREYRLEADLTGPEMIVLARALE